ncbi:hypothetical protein DWW90_02155 [Parabacteroides sp. AF17-28]|nr:hypothetical protein DWW90_02155 [Parabacteroides sp. AF17-28]
MGKVQILAVLTMDGCLSSELYDKAHQDLCLDRCGLDEIRKKAFYRVTPDYSISMLHEWRKDCTNIRYLAEATPLVECVDNFANNRRLTNLFETNCLNGKLIVCSMDLLHEQAENPEKKQLLYSLMEYMKSGAFNPSQQTSPAIIRQLLTARQTGSRERPESIY